MGFLDRLFGRDKEAAGDTTDDQSMRREGMQQEAKAEAEDRAESAENVAQEARDQASVHDPQQQTESES